MSRIAPNKKTVEQKRQEGTLRKSRSTEPVDPAEACMPKMPEWLSQSAKSVWRDTSIELESLNILSKTDQMAMAIYCELCAEYISDPKEFSASRMAQLRLLMGDLGLNPISRSRMPKKKVDKLIDNPFAKLISINGGKHDTKRTG